MTLSRRSVPLIACFSLVTACSSDGPASSAGGGADNESPDDGGANNGATDDGGGAGTDPRCPAVVPDAACDASRRPVVFVHGN